MANTYEAAGNTYKLDENWGNIRGSWVVSDVATDSAGRVYAACRENPYPEVLHGVILVFEPEGTYAGSWGDETIITPHGLWISPEDEIYHSDAREHTVRKYSTAGDLLQTIGTPGEIGAPGEPFNMPCRAKVSGSGDLYVADGYGQNRVHRMTLDGDVIVSWGHGDPFYTTGEGTPATGPGGFNLPHDVTVDDDDRVYVMDRENKRCQIFDNQGQYLTEWKDIGAPNDSVIDGGFMFIAGADPKSLRVMTLDGVDVSRWDEESQPELFEGYPHGMWIDREGSIYVAEVGARNRLQRFVRV